MKGNLIAGILLVLFFSLMGASVVTAAVRGVTPHTNKISFAFGR